MAKAWKRYAMISISRRHGQRYSVVKEQVWVLVA
jgi:hypothetical protein